MGTISYRVTGGSIPVKVTLHQYHTTDVYGPFTNWHYTTPEEGHFTGVPYGQWTIKFWHDDDCYQTWDYTTTSTATETTTETTTTTTTMLPPDLGNVLIEMGASGTYPYTFEDILSLEDIILLAAPTQSQGLVKDISNVYNKGSSNI